MSIIDYRSIPKARIIEGIQRLRGMEDAQGLTAAERDQLGQARQELLSRITDGTRRIAETQRRIYDRTGQHIAYDDVLIKLAENEEKYRASLASNHAASVAQRNRAFHAHARTASAKLGS